MDSPKPYLSADELAERTPWTPDAIEKMIRRGVLVRGVHFFQPSGQRGRLIFKWTAIVKLIEEQVVQASAESVLENQGRSKRATRRQVLDVEKATTDLQRLLD